MEISWWPPPRRDGAGFNFKKLKSLGETFSLSYLRDVHKAGAVRMVKKKGAGGGGVILIKQISYYNIFFSSKASLTLTFQEENTFSIFYMISFTRT